jgi:HEAT repeat protein
MAFLLGGCGRTPPHPVATPKARAEGPAVSPDPEAERPGRLADDDLLVSIRDGQVRRANFVTPVPAPKSEQQLAADALARIGPPAVPMLVQSLRSSDREVRRRACEILMRMGPDAKEAVPELIGLLGDEDEELRRMAATALGRIGPDAGDAVPALMRTMLQEEPEPAALNGAAPGE